MRNVRGLRVALRTKEGEVALGALERIAGKDVKESIEHLPINFYTQEIVRIIEIESF